MLLSQQSYVTDGLPMSYFGFRYWIRHGNDHSFLTITSQKRSAIDFVVAQFFLKLTGCGGGLELDI